MVLTAFLFGLSWFDFINPGVFFFDGLLKVNFFLLFLLVAVPDPPSKYSLMGII